MKVLTIIGNGLDLGHGLPTRFDNFVDSNSTFYKSKYDVFRDGNNSWNSIENKYQQLLQEVMSKRCWLEVSEEVERIIQDYGLTEYGEVDYYCYESEAWNNEFDRIENLVHLLEEFEKDFQDY